VQRQSAVQRLQELIVSNERLQTEVQIQALAAVGVSAPQCVISLTVSETWFVSDSQACMLGLQKEGAVLKLQEVAAESERLQSEVRQCCCTQVMQGHVV